MPLTISTRDVEGIGIVNLEGRLARGEASEALRSQIKHMLAIGTRKIVLNMDQISFLDSAGLSALVTAQHSAQSQTATLKLCSLGATLQNILEATKLSEAFEIFGSETAAILSFRDSAANPDGTTSGR